MEKKVSRFQALLTAIGIMIGVGIYFKADNIMAGVNGSFPQAMLVWSVITIGFIFAGLGASAIAKKLNPDGGIVGYFEQFFGKKMAFMIGWFQATIYVPILVVVLATVVSQYFMTLIGVNDSPFILFIGSIVIVLLTMGWNYLSTQLATMISVSATSLKVIPLIIICFCGIFFHADNIENLLSANHSALNAFSFLSPFIAIAFMFDGWINVGSMAVDMQNPQKDLPFVYVVSLVSVCLIYVLYFIGVNLLIDTNTLINQGDNYLYQIAQQIFGANGAKIVLVFVIISGIGTLNAMFMSGTRYIEKLAEDNLMFLSNYFQKRSKRDTPLNASILLTIFCGIIALILFLQAKHFTLFGYDVFQGILLEDAAVCVNSMFTGLLFVINFKLYQQKQLGVFSGIIAPTIAIIFHIVIVASYLFTSANFISSIASLFIIGIIIFIGLLINKEELDNK